MQPVDLIYAVRKVIQVFPCDQNIIVVGIFYCGSKFFCIDKGVFLINKENSACRILQDQFPVYSFQYPAWNRANQIYSA